jgi:DNA-binding MarR family transcriptional regulator
MWNGRVVPVDERRPVELDKIIHERARLMILTYLTGLEKDTASFQEIKDALELTSGNLSVQLKNLEQAGYIAIEKRFLDNRPVTEARLTPEGSMALTQYLDEMERIIHAARKSAAE